MGIGYGCCKNRRYRESSLARVSEMKRGPKISMAIMQGRFGGGRPEEMVATSLWLSSDLGMMPLNFKCSAQDSELRAT